MKKFLSLLLLLILLTGCAEQEVSNSPASTNTPTNMPVATPTPLFSYPDPFYDEEALENIGNYKFHSVSGVDEKTREDFATVEEFDAHVKAETLKKYNRLRAFVEEDWQDIDALYVHCDIDYETKGHHLVGKMDGIVTDPTLIREWTNAVKHVELIENTSFTTADTSVPKSGTTVTYCLIIDNEIVEFFSTSDLYVTYTEGTKGKYPYLAKKDTQLTKWHYNQLLYVDEQISKAFEKRFFEIYKRPINYPYILD